MKDHHHAVSWHENWGPWPSVLAGHPKILCFFPASILSFSSSVLSSKSSFPNCTFTSESSALHLSFAPFLSPSSHIRFALSIPSQSRFHSRFSAPETPLFRSLESVLSCPLLAACHCRPDFRTALSFPDRPISNSTGFNRSSFCILRNSQFQLVSSNTPYLSRKIAPAEVPIKDPTPIKSPGSFLPNEPCQSKPQPSSMSS